MPAVLVRKGIVGDWQSVMDDANQQFICQAVERGGLEWNSVIAPAE